MNRTPSNVAAISSLHFPLVGSRAAIVLLLAAVAMSFLSCKKTVDPAEVLLAAPVRYVTGRNGV